MKLLLDTCVISDIVKSIGKTRKKFIDAVMKDEIAVSTITLFEIEYGLNLNQAVSQKIGDDMEKICSTLQIVQFSKEAAYATAEIKAKLEEEVKHMMEWYMNKRRTRLILGFKSFYTANRTIKGIESMNMVMKRRIFGVGRSIIEQNNFINKIFGIYIYQPVNIVI